MTQLDDPPARAATAPANLRHEGLRAWVGQMAALCSPAAVRWCDGSEEEYAELCELLVESGTFIKLDERKRPNSYLASLRPERRRARRGPHVHLQP